MGKVAERILEIYGMIAASEKVTSKDRRDVYILGEAIHEIMQHTFMAFSTTIKTISLTIQYYREEIMELEKIV